MDVRTVIIVVIIIIIILVIVITISGSKYAQYVVVARNDGASKYIAIQDIDIIDSKGNSQLIEGFEGKGMWTTGFANSTSALAAAGGAAGDITFDGRKLAYVKDSGVAAAGTPTIGPVVSFLPSTAAASGYLIFQLGCPVKISRVNIRPPDDDTARSNMQFVKVFLLDKDRISIGNAEHVIPATSSNIPRIIYHISFS